MLMTKLAQDEELRITCKVDPERSVTYRGSSSTVNELLDRAGVVMTAVETGWVNDNGGAENDDWRARVVWQGEALDEGEMQG